MNFNRILAIGAHPDDVEYSCLGTLLKYDKTNSQICIYVASFGSLGDPTTGEHRKEESISSFKLLNNAQIIFRQSAGLSSENYENISQELRVLILSFKPDLILVHHSSDTHQEHRILHDITLTAARRYRCSILTYKSVSVTSSFVESLYVDVTEFLDDKIMAIQKHLSQSERDYMAENSIKLYHKNWFGYMHGIDSVEVFGIEQIII
jgi:LmbE family N-acetylglucosaminyl deacetylase